MFQELEMSTLSSQIRVRATAEEFLLHPEIKDIIKKI